MARSGSSGAPRASRLAAPMLLALLLGLLMAFLPRSMSTCSPTQQVAQRPRVAGPLSAVGYRQRAAAADYSSGKAAVVGGSVTANPSSGTVGARGHSPCPVPALPEVPCAGRVADLLVGQLPRPPDISNGHVILAALHGRAPPPAAGT